MKSFLKKKHSYHNPQKPSYPQKTNPQPPIPLVFFPKKPGETGSFCKLSKLADISASDLSRRCGVFRHRKIPWRFLCKGYVYSMSPGNNFLAEIVNGFASDDSFSFESWSIFGTFVVIFAGVMWRKVFKKLVILLVFWFLFLRYQAGDILRKKNLKRSFFVEAFSIIGHITSIIWFMARKFLSLKIRY